MKELLPYFNNDTEKFFLSNDESFRTKEEFDHIVLCSSKQYAAFAYNNIEPEKREYFVIDKIGNISEKHELIYNVFINNKFYLCYSDDIIVMDDGNGKLFCPKESWLYQPEQYSDPELIEFVISIDNRIFWEVWDKPNIKIIFPIQDVVKECKTHFRKFLEHEFKKRGLSFIFD